ncbi:unnamed protein product [Peronospora belbahrii]|uniref:Heterogeneous nuclear ribonucleoprotein Q acidic domain-containing protein n=1 Tax=Peronospora belbahrii TaxID=622444 RepID=A0ABN8D7K9_9STRA|nr:unnamed protein product [Peronospora belbahrii]
MDVDANTGANDGDTTPIAVGNDEMIASTASIINEAVDHEVSADKDAINKENEARVVTTEVLDNTECDVSLQPLDVEATEMQDDIAEDKEETAGVIGQAEKEQQSDVVIAESMIDTASVAFNTGAIEIRNNVLMEVIDDKIDPDESEAVLMDALDNDESDAELVEAIDDKSDEQESDAELVEASDDKSDEQESDAELVEASDDKSDEQESDAELVEASDDKSDEQEGDASDGNNDQNEGDAVDDIGEQDEGDAANKDDSAIGDSREEMIQHVEASGTHESLALNEEATIVAQQNVVMVDESVSAPKKGHSDNADLAESFAPSKETSGVLSDGQAENDVLPINVEAGALLPPAHDEAAYDLSAPSALSPSILHGDDEYDPANPSTTGTPAASDTTIGFVSHDPAAKKEYNLDNPGVTSAAPEESAEMEVDHTAASTDGEELSTVTPAKRKLDGESISTSDVAVNGNTDSKRPRHVDGNKSPRDDDHKHGRHRRSSGDSTLSSSSKSKQLDEDHKGLSAAAWDRLMDFQTSGEFRVTQVSRAAFASVGAMPEFAQIAIIARFVRTPMRDIRDKNGQLMRIFREYQKENPQIAALQPVDAFISDYKSDPRLFRFGYAPPQPATGISIVQVPYQRDQPSKDLPAKNSPRQGRSTAGRSEPDHPRKDVDEFGRVVHLDKGIAIEPSRAARSTNDRSIVDPRLSSRNRQGLSSPSAQAVSPATTGGRAEDPRRRDQPNSQSSSGAGRDPRRRGPSSSQQPSPRGVLPGASRMPNPSDLYERLPPAVKAVVNSMRHEGRLQEPLNDNVVTRLLHLPERVALQAVENFSNVDLSQVENLQGFLVGIINRVNEKAIASEKQHRPQMASPRGHTPSAIPLGGNYGVPSQGGSVLGGPPQGGRLNSNNVANDGGYRGQPVSMATGPAPALYERPYDAQQDMRDPRRRQAAPQGLPQYGGVQGPPLVGMGHGPIGMHSFTVLPLSVQNHIHSLVANRTLASLEELGGKCYEVLGQLSEPLANQVLTRFAGANLSNVRNKSGFLIGVVKRARQEYGFD